jgi:hypothetical protein
MRRKPSHGGRRPGAGRKPIDAEGRGRPVTIFLTPTDEARLRRLAPTFSEAVRRLLAPLGYLDERKG